MAEGSDRTAGRAPWLGMEFAALYLGVPLLLALAAPASWLWPVLLATTAVALALLAADARIRLGRAGAGLGSTRLALVAAVAAVTALVSRCSSGGWCPGRRCCRGARRAVAGDPAALSAAVGAAAGADLPGAVLPALPAAVPGSTQAAVAASGLVFALAHLMFWNWVALLLTCAGGVIFARAYLGRGGFALAVALHAVCGWVIFTSGLGSFFYHGAVGR